MRVYFACSYYSQWAHKNLTPRNQEQWDAFKFCRAVKKKLINGSAYFHGKNQRILINSQNVHVAREIFGKFIDFTIKNKGLVFDFIVPVPSKDGLVGVQSYRTLQMLRDALPRELLPQLNGAIRFTEQLQPANAGGPRGEHALKPYVTADAELSGKAVVLVDDILTTGGTMKAAISAVEAVGGTVVGALVCGYTVSDSIRPAFGLQHIDLVMQESFI